MEILSLITDDSMRSFTFSCLILYMFRVFSSRIRLSLEGEKWSNGARRRAIISTSFYSCVFQKITTSFHCTAVCGGFQHGTVRAVYYTQHVT